MELNRLLYEKSVPDKGHLIIPFVFGMVDKAYIYSYSLLAEVGHKSEFHQAENPAQMYSSHLDEIIRIAQEHLAENSLYESSLESFKHRYTYCHNLIIVSEMAGKYFYDHYPPNRLNNIAAPRIFSSESECISWVKQGLDQSRSSPKPELTTEIVEPGLSPPD
ncbi:hypothetical protein NDA01_13240 [Trichocoleus desertorum AS-A10]|uniref:hypothetical protein n=1 Tax=Trichocoleus desertorum TaxID=1481672 RepID=UPI003299D2D3